MQKDKGDARRFGYTGAMTEQSGMRVQKEMTGQPDLPNSCGSCTVCCLVLRIDEFTKPAGTLCQHCTGKGCGIYETRYDVCRGYLCGWRTLPKLGDDWRPDRSGILLTIIGPEDLDDVHRPQGHGVNFIIVGGEKAILRPGFAEYITTLVSRNVAVYLSADSPKTLINKYLQPLVAAKNKPGVIEMLLHIYRQHVKLREIKEQKPLPWVHIS